MFNLSSIWTWVVGLWSFCSFVVENLLTNQGGQKTEAPCQRWRGAFPNAVRVRTAPVFCEEKRNADL